MTENRKVVVNLATGLEDAERVTCAFLVGGAALEQGELVDTYASSAFEGTRRKAAKFGAMGSTIKAYKPDRRNDG